MKVLRADAYGLCFGVRDALAEIEAAPDPAAIAVFGELVHNPLILDRLAQRGFTQIDEHDRTAIPEPPIVMITAHGVSQRERDRLSAAGKQLLDTTCPLVRRVHEAALRLEQEGFHVIVLGRRGHVEVQGIIGDLNHCHVVGTEAEVETYPQRRLGLVCQTTLPPRDAQRLRQAIAERNPHAEIRFVDTVCQPTKDRQAALERLLEKVEAVVVVGGKQSNNTQQLARLCEDHGIRALHVESAAELCESWFDGIDSVGVTAGTSTLDATFEEVVSRLHEVAARRIHHAN